MGAGSRKKRRVHESRTGRLQGVLRAILGLQATEAVLSQAGWSVANDGPHNPRYTPLNWVDQALFDALLHHTTLEVADSLRREARGVMLSTVSRPGSLVPPPSSGVRVSPIAMRQPANAAPSPSPAPSAAAALQWPERTTSAAQRTTRRPPRKRAEPTPPPAARVPTGRSTVAPALSGGVVLWTDDEHLAEELEARFGRDETLFRVADLAQLRSALFVFTGRSPLVVLDRRGLSSDELSELRPSELDSCDVVLWGTPNVSSPRLEGALSRVSRVVGCAAEAAPHDVVDLCASIRRPSVRP